MQFNGIVTVVLPTYAAAVLHAKYFDQPVYYYSYEHVSEGATPTKSINNVMFDFGLVKYFTNGTETRTPNYTLRE